MGHPQGSDRIRPDIEQNESDYWLWAKNGDEICSFQSLQTPWNLKSDFAGRNCRGCILIMLLRSMYIAWFIATTCLFGFIPQSVFSESIFNLLLELHRCYNLYKEEQSKVHHATNITRKLIYISVLPQGCTSTSR